MHTVIRRRIPDPSRSSINCIESWSTSHDKYHRTVFVNPCPMLCYVFLCKLRGPPWSVGSYSIGPLARGISQKNPQNITKEWINNGVWVGTLFSSGIRGTWLNLRMSGWAITPDTMTNTQMFSWGWRLRSGPVTRSWRNASTRRRKSSAPGWKARMRATISKNITSTLSWGLKFTALQSLRVARRNGTSSGRNTRQTKSRQNKKSCWWRCPVRSIFGSLTSQ